MHVLLLIFLGCGFPWAAGAPPGGDWSGRADAEEILAKLDRPEKERIQAMVEAVDRDPEDLDARNGLKKAVEEIFLGGLQRLHLAGRPEGSGAKGSALRQACYRFLTAQTGDAALQSVCWEGYRDFERGRYMLAADHLTFCKGLYPNAGWVWQARRLCREFLSQNEAMNGPDGRHLLRAFKRFIGAAGRSDWSRALHSFDAVLEHFHRRGDTTGLSEELETLVARLRSRVEAQKLPSGPEFYEEHARGLLESDPGRAIDEFEAAYFASSEDPARAARIAELLRAAYARRAIEDALRRARRASAAGDLDSVMRSVAAVLRRDPRDERALHLLKASGVEERKNAAIQAQAYYDRGLQAYVQGDLPQAAGEWRSALKADPEFRKAGKALARVLKELDLKAATQKDRTEH